MTKTVKEVFAEQIIGPSPGYSIEDADADAIIAALDAAGFVITKRPKGDGTAIPDYVPPEATREQLIDVIQSIGGLLMQNGYEANNYLDLHAASFEMVVHFQDAQYIVEELATMFKEARDGGLATIESAVGAKFNHRVAELAAKLRI